MKRNPDSVANLIRAAAVSDSVEARERERDAQVQTLRDELQRTKELHERRLRSLRLEHDRVKQRYEGMVADLEQELHMQPRQQQSPPQRQRQDGVESGAGKWSGAPGSATKIPLPVSSAGGAGSGAGGRKAGIRTLSEALNRIG